MRARIPPTLTLHDKGGEEKTRRGLTLVELLVVISIIVALMAMIALAAPRFAERQGPSRGAGQLQSWINLARQMSIRDQRPRGLRMLVPAVTMGPAANYCRSLVYTEQPDDFRAGTESRLDVPASIAPEPNAPPVGDYTWVRITDFTRPVANGVPAPVSIPFAPAAANQAVDPNCPVQPERRNSNGQLIVMGDVLQINDTNIDFGKPRRIMDLYQQVQGPSFPKVYFVRLDKALDNASTMTPPNYRRYQTQQYLIFRQPRPMAGEPLLQLPVDVGIDFSADPDGAWYRFFPPPGGNPTNQPLTIMFNTNGSVQSFGDVPYPITSSRICLWVHGGIGPPEAPIAIAPTEMPPGDNSLITIYTRTGLVSTHPVDPSGLVPSRKGSPTWNPFRFTQDNISSGQ